MPMHLPASGRVASAPVAAHPVRERSLHQQPKRSRLIQRATSERPLEGDNDS